MGNKGNPANAKCGIPSKREDFNEYYAFVVQAAGLVDRRYPVKGMDVFLPYGLQALRKIWGLVRAELDARDHDEVSMPTLVPADLLDKESRLVNRLRFARERDTSLASDSDKDFASEVFWVRQGGKSDLDLPLFLRPTSETALCAMLPLWIRSHADLPRRIFQINRAFRYETNQPCRSLIRAREFAADL